MKKFTSEEIKEFVSKPYEPLQRYCQELCMKKSFSLS